MSEYNKEKALAVAKMAGGILRIGSGVAMATGHGLLGAAMKKHHMMGAAAKLGRSSVVGGYHLFEEGFADWKHAQRQSEHKLPEQSQIKPTI